MGFESFLCHTCVIRRELPGDENAIGNPSASQHFEVYRGDCRLVERERRVWSTEMMSLVNVSEILLMLPAGAAVAPRDEIKSLTLEDGTELVGAFTVLAPVIRRGAAGAHHISVKLERVE